MMATTGKILRYSKINARLVRFIMPFSNASFDLGWMIVHFRSAVKQVMIYYVSQNCGIIAIQVFPKRLMLPCLWLRGQHVCHDEEL